MERAANIGGHKHAALHGTESHTEPPIHATTLPPHETTPTFLFECL